jgi:hypothetical protein
MPSEHAVAVLSSVLRGERDIEVVIAVQRYSSRSCIA